MKIEGLGDIIEFITTHTGIKLIVKFWNKITKSSCLCERRRQTLNEKFPINNNLK